MAVGDDRWLQDLIDAVYDTCSDHEQTNDFGNTVIWNSDAAPVVRTAHLKPVFRSMCVMNLKNDMQVKARAEQCGCAGAARLSPTVFSAALVWVVAHFFN